MMRKTARRRRAITAIPPTTPPTIAPIGVDFLCGVIGAAVAEVDAEEEDDDEDELLEVEVGVAATREYK
jgi:hypothetical protein